VKRWLDRGFDPDKETRDTGPTEPVRVEPLEAGRERPSYVLLPVLLAALFVIALGAAMVSHFGVFSSSPTVEPTLPTPTPIAWVDTTAGPTESARPDGASSNPQAPLLLRASIRTDGNLWSRGRPSHFTLDLTNPTATPVSRSPCPTYRMYLTGIDNSTAPVRLLNCAAIGPELPPGQTVSLDMVYTPATDDPLTGEKLVWQWTTPDTIQAIATLDVSIGP
jgi:hypothetical protein